MKPRKLTAESLAARRALGTSLRALAATEEQARGIKLRIDWGRLALGAIRLIIGAVAESLGGKDTKVDTPLRKSRRAAKKR